MAINDVLDKYELIKENARLRNLAVSIRAKCEETIQTITNIKNNVNYDTVASAGEKTKINTMETELTGWITKIDNFLGL